MGGSIIRETETKKQKTKNKKQGKANINQHKSQKKYGEAGERGVREKQSKTKAHDPKMDTIKVCVRDIK